MTTTSMRAAGVAVLLSAALHIIAPIFGGVAVGVLILALVGVILAAAAFGVMRGQRWLAHLTFVILLIDAVAVFIASYAIAPLPTWLLSAIAFVDLIALAALFVTLWKPAPKLV